MGKHLTFNIQHSTSNERVGGEKLGVRCSRLNVGCFGFGWRRIVIAALFALAFFEVSLPAQTPLARESSGRYLLIANTSKAMRQRATAVEKSVNNLLLSGMNTQLRRGDTMGMWTYNEQLYAGHLPLQWWTPEDKQLIASNIVAFLKAQRFEKKSLIDTVWPALQNLVAESEKLTVLLISDGDEKISGTPFDHEINEFFKANASMQKKKRMPFITVLRSYRGQFTGVTLNLAPWPVEFPPFPPEPKVAATPISKPPPGKTTPQPATPPLVVIGNKPETVPIAPAKPAPVTPATPADDLPAAIVEPKSLPVPAPKETPQAASVQPVTPPVAPAPTTAPTETAPAPPTATIHPKQDVVPDPSPLTKPGIEPESPAVELPKPLLPLVESVNPEPVSPSATVKQPPANPPAQVATATQLEKGFCLKNLLVIGVVGLVLLIALLILLQRRALAVPHVSLITRSMDQDKK